MVSKERMINMLIISREPYTLKGVSTVREGIWVNLLLKGNKATYVYLTKAFLTSSTR